MYDQLKIAATRVTNNKVKIENFMIALPCKSLEMIDAACVIEFAP